MTEGSQGKKSLADKLSCPPSSATKKEPQGDTHRSVSKRGKRYPRGGRKEPWGSREGHRRGDWDNWDSWGDTSNEGYGGSHSSQSFPQATPNPGNKIPNLLQIQTSSGQRADGYYTRSENQAYPQNAGRPSQNDEWPAPQQASSQPPGPRRGWGSGPHPPHKGGQQW